MENLLKTIKFDGKWLRDIKTDMEIDKFGCFLESGTNKVKEDGQENIWHVWSQDKGNEAGAWIEATAASRVAGDRHAYV